MSLLQRKTDTSHVTPARLSVNAAGGNETQPKHVQASPKKIVRKFSGVVISAKMNKTLVVAVHRQKEHPKYRKRYRVTRRYHVHDAHGEYREGDHVIFQECRPLAKTKRWRAQRRSNP
jgi:small subunit ribosomal protein S17